MNSKISIIVPVYNVEPYIRKAVDSLLAQTYENLEILLVDDGSQDGCGAICDEYAAKDARVMVIHKENGGVASARNAGLDAATGEYIGWLDPDDWVEGDTYEYLLSGLLGHGADIALCGREQILPDRRLPVTWECVTELTRGAAMAELLRDKTIRNFLCDKLFRAKLFDGLRFPEGKIYEDASVMTMLFERAEKVLCLPGIHYHYLSRPGSLVNDIALPGRICFFEAMVHRYEDMKDRWPEHTALLAAKCLEASLHVWTVAPNNTPEIRGNCAAALNAMATFSKTHWEEAKDSLTLPWLGKMAIYLTRYPANWAYWGTKILMRLHRMFS